MMGSQLQGFFTQLFHLARIFWGDKKNWSSWIILATVIAIGVFIVSLNVMINDWSKHFYDTLAELKRPAYFASYSRIFNLCRTLYFSQRLSELVT